MLANGFRLHADRHETDASTVKLYADGGVTEMPSGQIVRFEQDDYVAPAAASIAPAEAAAVTGPSAPGAVLTAKPLDPKQLADAAARKNNLPEALIRSIMHAESGYRANAISPKGAIGLMQLMPGTALELHADPRDPEQNVEAGTSYLRSLLIRYQAHDDQVARAVAAYNAGPGAVDRYNGVPPYRETHDYVVRVLTEYLKTSAESPKP